MRSPWLSSVLLIIACGAPAATAVPTPVAPAAVASAPAPPPPVTPAVTPAPPPAVTPAPPPPLPEAPAWTATGTPAPHVVAALALIPASARYVIGLDVARLLAGPAGGTMGPMLAALFDVGPASCASVSLRQFDRVILAGVGTGSEQLVFLGPSLVERATARCISEAVIKKSGVTIKQRKRFGRTVYYGAGPDADASDFVAWTPANGPVTGREDWLLAALDPKAAKAGPALVALATTVDHGRMVWIAAQLVPSDLERLNLPPGLITGPIALRASVDLAATIEVDVDLGFATAEEAQRAAVAARAELDRSRVDPVAAAFARHVRLGVHGAALRLLVHVDEAATAALVEQIRTPSP